MNKKIIQYRKQLKLINLYDKKITDVFTEEFFESMIIIKK